MYDSYQEHSQHSELISDCSTCWSQRKEASAKILSFLSKDWREELGKSPVHYKVVDEITNPNPLETNGY